MVDEEDIYLDDWNQWMDQSPGAIAAALQESPADPEIIAANIFRRIFPNRPWPPEEGTVLAEKWDRFVQVIGHEIGIPVRSTFHVVS